MFNPTDEEPHVLSSSKATAQYPVVCQLVMPHQRLQHLLLYFISLARLTSWPQFLWHLIVTHSSAQIPRLTSLHLVFYIQCMPIWHPLLTLPFSCQQAIIEANLKARNRQGNRHTMLSFSQYVHHWLYHNILMPMQSASRTSNEPLEHCL